MRKFNGYCRKYKFNIVVFSLLTLTMILSCLKNYLNNVFPFDADGIFMEVATQSFIRESLQIGEYPLWNKYLSAGMSAAGNISMHCFYLPAVILSFLPLKQFVYCDYIMHLTIGSMFFFLLLKQLGCRKEIAAVMAFVYQFSVNLGGMRKTHMPIIFTAIYLPIIIYFIENYLKTKKLKWLIYAAIAMALQFCGGFMQCVLYSDVFVGLYLLTGLFRNRKSWKRWVGHFCIWLGGYFGLIAIQLVPFLELLKENSVYDRASSSYEFFVSYSLHPIKLLQMVFPKIFVDEFFAFGADYSSGMDIELYMGPVIILLLVCGISIYRKEYRIKAYSIAAALVLAWASIGRFPALAKIVNKIPMIGETRAQSRIIFIFCFLTLLMVGYISELLVNRQEYRKIFDKTKSLVFIILGVVLAGFAGAFVHMGTKGFTNDSWEDLLVYFNNSYGRDIILYLLCVFVFWALNQNEEKRKGKKKYVFLGFFLAINMYGVLPYTLRAAETPVDSVMGINSASDDFLKENAMDYKVWDDFARIDGSHQSNISQNMSVIKKIQSINSFTNFSNPRIYMMMSMSDDAPLNYSGLLTGNLIAGCNLTCRNDVLSMLGIKYIIDTEGFLKNCVSTYSFSDMVKEVLYVRNVTGDKGDQSVFISNNEIVLKPETFYKVTFNGFALNNEEVYFDFYGEQYDSNEQQREFMLTSDKKQFEFYVFSGEEVPQKPLFRFVCPEMDSEFLIEDVHVTEMRTYETEAYRLAYTDGNIDIYENINANNVLYFSSVLKMNEENHYYEAIGLQLDENSYICGGEELNNLSLNKQITAIEFGVNSIKAEVYVDERSFINFSQTYYPGWKVYVDGEEQELYIVNGVIMGVYLPIGDHKIEFSYEPLSVRIGALISFLTLIILIFIGWIIPFRNKKRFVRGLQIMKEGSLL